MMIVSAAASVMLLQTSCEQGTDNGSTVSVNIEVVAAEGVEVPTGTVFDVTVTNYDTRTEQTASTDESGKVSVSGLVMGRYTVTATASVSFSAVCAAAVESFVLHQGLSGIVGKHAFQKERGVPAYGP